MKWQLFYQRQWPINREMSLLGIQTCPAQQSLGRDWEKYGNLQDPHAQSQSSLETGVKRNGSLNSLPTPVDEHRMICALEGRSTYLGTSLQCVKLSCICCFQLKI